MFPVLYPAMKGHLNSGLQKRILVYFVLVIVIPCVLMGGLAFRGLRNDQALLEIESRRQALQMGEDIIQSTNQVFNRVENDLARYNHKLDLGDKIFFSDSLLADFADQEPLVFGILYSKGQKVWILHRKAQFGVQNTYVENQIPLKDEQMLETGWQYEFQHKNNQLALEHYQNLLPKLKNKQSIAQATKAMARLYKKNHLNQKAIQTYHSLGMDFGDFRINQTMPLGLISDLELTKLFLLEKDTTAALKRQVLLLKNLIESKWLIDKSTYDLFVAKTEEFLAQLIVQNNTEHIDLIQQVDSLNRIRYDLEHKTLAMMDVCSIIADRKSTQSISQPVEAARWLEKVRGSRHIIALTPCKIEGAWYIVYKLDQLVSQYLGPYLKNVSSRNRWSWSLQNEKGEFLVQTNEAIADTDHIKLSFPSLLVNWSLLGYNKPMSFIQSLVWSGQGIYLYLFLFIGSILIAGLIFVLYTVNRELQLTAMKSEFINTVSHEFKSPLTAIKQMVEMLQDERVPSDKKSKYYNVILQQGARLSQMIDNILDFSKIERGKKAYHFRETDLVELVKNSVDRFQKRVVDKEIQFRMVRFPKDQVIILDPESIQQVMINLLDNAVKYSGDSKKVDVSILEKEASALVEVKDYGVGIPLGEITKIFDRFHRAENLLTQNIKGSGIGLSLVKEIIEIHGGNVKVNSSLGEGSTFTFSLPKNNHHTNA